MWRGIAIILKKIAPPELPRQLCSFPDVRPISFSMEPRTSHCVALLLFLPVLDRLFAFLCRPPRPQDGHDRTARRETEWNRGRRAMPVSPKPRFRRAPTNRPAFRSP